MKEKNKIILTLSLSLLIVLALILGARSYYINYNKIEEKNDHDQEIKIVKDQESTSKDEDPSAEAEDESAILEDRIETVNILAVGDIMFHMPQVNGAYTGEGYDFRPNFKYVKDIIENSDLALANLETVLGGEELGYSGFPHFNSPDEVAMALKDSGFDIISTANNHSLDQGREGIARTIDVLEAAGLENIGTFKEGPRYMIKEINDIKIGLLAYTYGLNGMGSLLSDEERPHMIGLIDEDRIKTDLDALQDQTDINIIFIHWGLEYHSHPSQEQIDLAEKIFDWGGDIILGSHPHVVQKYRHREDGKYVIYSMGNFLSNQRERWLNQAYVENGLIVQLEIEKDFNSNQSYVKNIHHIPTWVYMYHDGASYKHEIIPIENHESISNYENLGEEDQIRMLESYNETMDVLEGRR